MFCHSESGRPDRPAGRHALDALVPGLPGPRPSTGPRPRWALLRNARLWEVHAGESFNDRQWKIINRLLDGYGGKLTFSGWAKLAPCTQDTANRDINDLFKRGIPAKDAAGGRSTSCSLIEPSATSAPGT